MSAISAPAGGLATGEAVDRIVARLRDIDAAVLDRAGVHDALRSLARVKGWHDATIVALTRRLNELAEGTPSILPEADLASGSNSSRRDAANVAKRVDTLDAVPAMAPELEVGGVSVDHVDALGRALQRLDPRERELLAADGARIVELASRTTPEQFHRALQHEIARLDRSRGADRLTAQKQARSFRSWTDRDSGMWCFHGQLDPETGLKVAARIEATVESLFHDQLPDDCPTGESKQDWLRAAAFTGLVLRRSSDRPTAGEEIEITELDHRAELIVVIDWRTIADGVHPDSIIDNGHDLELPVESYRRMACHAAIIPLVLDGDGVALDLGRAQRLANRQQRRALRGMYATCGVPGCHVRSRHCQPHHIDWWRHFGPTDLANLIPLCSRHHHQVHEGGWKLLMHPDRSVTITLPDGNTIHGPPPRRHRTAA